MIARKNDAMKIRVAGAQIVVDSGARLLLDVQLDARGRAAQDDAQLARRRRLAALQGLLQQTKERVRMRLRYVIDIAFDHDLEVAIHDGVEMRPENFPSIAAHCQGVVVDIVQRNTDLVCGWNRHYRSG